MSIKEQIVASLERQISDIKALEERQVAVIKDKVIREKVAPFNQEIDQARVKAENELLQKLNALFLRLLMHSQSFLYHEFHQ